MGIGKSVSNGFDSVGGINESGRSIGSMMSHMSIQSFNDKGREYVVKVFQQIEKQLHVQQHRFMEDGKVGSLSHWQKELMRDLGDESVDVELQPMMMNHAARGGSNMPATLGPAHNPHTSTTAL